MAQNSGLPSTAATFDPLDASLYDAHKYFQDLPDVVRTPHYQRWYWADPKNWEKHLPPDWVFDLKWKEYRYSDIKTRPSLNGILTDTKPGIYLFTVRPKRRLDNRFPDHVFYVGISNEKGTKRPLRERLGDYLPSSLSTIKKRKNIHKLLMLYYDSTWVRCAYVTKSSKIIISAEEKLHGYFSPPVAVRDYPADMKPFKPAF